MFRVSQVECQPLYLVTTTAELRLKPLKEKAVSRTPLTRSHSAKHPKKIPLASLMHYHRDTVYMNYNRSRLILRSKSSHRALQRVRHQQRNPFFSAQGPNQVHLIQMKRTRLRLQEAICVIKHMPF